jgi:outer membrane protein assembly factor BamA
VVVASDAGRRVRLLALTLVLALAGARTARAEKSFIPIPEILTDPNEGTTFGLLGVVLFLDDKDQVQYILAPDARYNKTKGFFPTFRFLGYPTPTRRYSIVVGKSTTRDEDYEAEFTDRGLLDGRAFVLASVLHERDSTERFFGIGNGTTQDDESNYTDVDTLAQATPGVWILPHLNATYRMRVRHYSLERGQVDNVPCVGSGPGPCPDSTEPSPPATRNRKFRRSGVFWAHRVALTYDSRDEMDIPRRGALAQVYTELADRHLGSESSFVKFGIEWRKFIPLWAGNPILALRALADYTSGSSDTPFWEQSKLGGRRTLRGFGSQRFVDFNRSLAGAEVRTRVWQHPLFGVNAELEVAPFVEAGQVFHHVRDSPVSDLHWVGGLGFRGVVRPQIVGFVDVGYGAEGSAIFTGIDYPF